MKTKRQAQAKCECKECGNEGCGMKPPDIFDDWPDLEDWPKLDLGDCPFCGKDDGKAQG